VLAVTSSKDGTPSPYSKFMVAIACRVKLAAVGCRLHADHESLVFLITNARSKAAFNAADDSRLDFSGGAR
jgi:hypothetical protein